MTHETPESKPGPSRAASKKPRGRSEAGPVAGSCRETLEAVIELAQATLSEPWAEAERCIVSGRLIAKRPASGHAPSANGSSPLRAPPGARRPAPLSAQQQLALTLRGLEPELALKLRTLMVAGRDGQSIHAVKIHMTLADGTSSFHAAADDTSENGPLLAEYLRRGHALAQASGLDLERPIAGWSKADASGDERDWQRFGRQLAQSHPDEWQCLLVAGEAPEHGSQLYLQHAEHGSWSFHAQLDRAEPAATVGLHRHATGPGVASVSTRSLGALVPRLRKAQGVALRRAARAICARVGAAT